MIDPMAPVERKALIHSIECLDRHADACLDEIDNWQDYGESVMLVLHELKRLRQLQLTGPSALRAIEPDALDLRLCSTTALARCPFCDHDAVTHHRYREDTAIFRSTVSCTGCMAEVGYNASTKEEARKGAIERWERRSAPTVKAEESSVEAPDAYLINWWPEGSRPRCRVQLSNVLEPWLEELSPTITPLYRRAAPAEARSEQAETNTFEVGKPAPYFCPACQAIPRAGYCKLAGCPTAPEAR